MKIIFLLIILTFLFQGCKHNTNDNLNNISRIQKDTLQSPSLSSITIEIPKKVILFIQWQYNPQIDEIEALNTRHKVEVNIENKLKESNLGDWIAGDLGPGGANMLFEVVDKQKALKLIQKILKKEGIYKEAIIAERIYLTSDNWTYKVIFPQNFKGVFDDS